MICPNCGSLQDSNAAVCTVCGYEFDLRQKPSIAPAANKKLNKWEILLIIFWLLLFFIVLYLLAPLIITLVGKTVFFPIILIPVVTIFGIAKKEKWAYYITFGFCIFILLITLMGLITSSVAFGLFIRLMIIMVPTLFFAWKAYMEIKKFK